MIVDRSASRPPAWPPTSEPMLVYEQLRRGMLRDRFGHWVQTLLACLFAFAGALDHAPLNVATVMLITCFVIRLHASWRAMPTLLRVPALLPCALLTLWMLLGLAWTSGDATAINDLTILRWIVILPALWPVLDHAREIAIAFILGTLVQNGAQFLQLAECIPRPDGNYWRYSGFINHPGDSALRSAMSIVLALALASSTRGTARGLLLLASCIALTGVLIAAGRGQILALAFAVPLLLLLLRRGGFLTVRAMWVGIAALILTALVVLPTVGRASLRYFEDVPEQLSSAATGDDLSSSIGVRVAWWKDASALWLKHPIVGAGLGSYASESHARNLDAASHTSHPHNMYIGVLCEGGLVGLALLAWMLWALLRVGVRNAKHSSLACGAVAAIVVVLVSGMTSDPQYREMDVSNAMIMVALGCLPWVRGWRS